jgi:hypothetical protein
LKVGKDIAVGMVVAVDALIKQRDVLAEQAEWRAWWSHIASVVCQTNGVTADVGEPVRGGPFPILNVTWDQALVPTPQNQMVSCIISTDPARCQNVRVITCDAGQHAPQGCDNQSIG